ncbi:MAG TPA: PAS domain S-box protein [Polyangiales bacterium]|nr:PAS domain S-box protein [Polyangiales bacterium]
MDQAAPILLIASDLQRAGALKRAIEARELQVILVDSAAHVSAQLPRVAAIVACVSRDEAPRLLELRKQKPFDEPPLMIACGDDHCETLALVTALGADDFVAGDHAVHELGARLARLLREDSVKRELARKQRDMQLTLELTRTLSSSLDFRDILFTVVRRVAEAVHIDRVSIVLTPEDEPGTGYVIAASDDQGLSDLRIQLAKYPEIEQVLRTQEALTIHDVANHPVLDNVRESVARLASLALIPITLHERVIGVLFLRMLEDKLSKDELDVCMIIANTTGSALRNAHLMQKLRRDHKKAQDAAGEAEAQAERATNTAAELRKTKEFLEALIEASVDAIVAADLTGTIILYNKSAERIYGHTREEVIGKMHVSRLYPEGGAKEVMRRIRSSDWGGAGRLDNLRSFAVDKDGNRIPTSLSAAMIFEHGQPTSTVGIFTDLRERLLTEERLAQTQQKLEVSEKQALLAELAGTAAHELNQPLTSVMGYGELLIRRLPAGTPERNAAQVIMQEAERMANLVRKIGKITRYETKSYVGDQRILDLDRAADDEPEPADKR